MSDTKSTSDEAIGRPSEWREGRYQKAGQALEPAVKDTPAGDAGADKDEAPVTKKDYESLASPKPTREGNDPD